MCNDLLQLDRIVSLGWKRKGTLENIDSVIRTVDNLDLPTKRIDLFRAANGVLKAAQFSDTQEVRSLKSKLLERLMQNLEAEPIVPSVSASTVCTAVSNLEFSDITILCDKHGSTVDDFIHFCEAAFNKTPRVLVLSVASRCEVPPWQVAGAWYYENTTSDPHLDTAKHPDASLTSWEGLVSWSFENSTHLVMGIGLPIIPRDVLVNSQCTIINLHNGLLPLVRGLDSPAWSVIGGYPCGSTLHVIEPGVDTGQIAAQTTVACRDHSLPSKRDYSLAKIKLWRDAISKTNRGFALKLCDSSPIKLPGQEYHALHGVLRDILSSHLSRHLSSSKMCAAPTLGTAN